MAGAGFTACEGDENGFQGNAKDELDWTCGGLMIDMDSADPKEGLVTLVEVKPLLPPLLLYWMGTVFGNNVGSAATIGEPMDSGGRSPVMKGCIKASAAVILRFGSFTSKRCMKSKHAGLTCLLMRGIIHHITSKERRIIKPELLLHKLRFLRECCLIDLVDGFPIERWCARQEHVAKNS
jgi:hypothetical protein